VLHADERTPQIYAEDAIPFLDLDLCKRRRLVLDAGIVECAVDAPEGLNSTRDRSLD
jgi:hypothetical protein